MVLRSSSTLARASLTPSSVPKSKDSDVESPAPCADCDFSARASCLLSRLSCGRNRSACPSFLAASKFRILPYWPYRQSCRPRSRSPCFPPRQTYRGADQLLFVAFGRILCAVRGLRDGVPPIVKFTDLSTIRSITSNRNRCGNIEDSAEGRPERLNGTKVTRG